MTSDLPYVDSLDVLFGSAYGFRISQVNAAPYEALKARGLDLISDDSVRLGVVRVYETHYSDIRWADEVITNVSFEVLRPYYLAHFRDIQFLQRATPLDYSRVARDNYFHNLLDYRLTVLRRSVLPRYQKAIADMDHLIQALDQELAQRQ